MSTELSHFIIDLGQLTRNWQWLNSKTNANCHTACVVKADGYGHGMNAVAFNLFEAGCRTFCVARLDEAVQLRSFFIQKNVGIDIVEIISFDGLQTSDIALYQRYKIIPALKQVSEIEFSINTARKAAKKFPVWMQLDTGMNRLGISENELNSFFEEGIVNDMNGLDIKVIMSHLSCSDAPNHSANEKQRTRFIKMSKKFQTASLSLSASHGLLISENFHFDITRPGIALYGYQDNPGINFGCKPILNWMAPILQIRDINKGEQIGYGADYTASQPMRIATIGAGYADGYNRSLSSFGKIEVGGYICKPVGRISMDSLVIDISNVPEAYLAEISQVCLLGEHYNAKDMASDLSTISYEILTNLGSRPKRLYKK